MNMILRALMVSVWFMALTFPLVVLKVDALNDTILFRWENMASIGVGAFVLSIFWRWSMERKARGAVSAQVVTAVPLTPAQSKGVAQALRTALGKDPEIETRVDPSILGGIKVRVGSRLFDASLRSKLDSLKFALKRA